MIQTFESRPISKDACEQTGGGSISSGRAGGALLRICHAGPLQNPFPTAKNTLGPLRIAILGSKNIVGPLRIAILNAKNILGPLRIAILGAKNTAGPLPPAAWRASRATGEAFGAPGGPTLPSFWGKRAG